MVDRVEWRTVGGEMFADGPGWEIEIQRVYRPGVSVYRAFIDFVGDGARRNELDTLDEAKAWSERKIAERSAVADLTAQLAAAQARVTALEAVAERVRLLVTLWPWGQERRILSESPALCAVAAQLRALAATAPAAPAVVACPRCGGAAWGETMPETCLRCGAMRMVGA